MKMEKLNDYQIKFMLSNQDLQERNITFEDLFHRSDKLQGLVREIMKKASETIDFNVNESPVMVEAHPHPDGIALIVSKTPDKNDPKTNSDRKKYLSNLYNEFVEKHMSGRDTGFGPGAESDYDSIIDDEAGRGEHFSVMIYSFDSLSDAVNACSIGAADYSGDSMFIKKDGSYYLILHCTYRDLPASVRNCFMEYGESVPAQSGKLGMLTEYGKVIIKENAVKALAECR